LIRDEEPSCILWGGFSFVSFFFDGPAASSETATQEIAGALAAK
jgi:hypothetical protein